MANGDHDIDEETAASLFAFHAHTGPVWEIVPALAALLSLFDDEDKSVAMILHSITLVQKCVRELNPWQIPVIAFVQPLHAIAKTIHWNWPNIYGQDKRVVMFGGLHIEMAILKFWLDGSGWTSALVQANVASLGNVETFLKVSNVSRTRRAHKVTPC